MNIEDNYDRWSKWVTLAILQGTGDDKLVPAERCCSQFSVTVKALRKSRNVRYKSFRFLQASGRIA